MYCDCFILYYEEIKKNFEIINLIVIIYSRAPHNYELRESMLHKSFWKYTFHYCYCIVWICNIFRWKLHNNTWHNRTKHAKWSNRLRNIRHMSKILFSRLGVWLNGKHMWKYNIMHFNWWPTSLFAYVWQIGCYEIMLCIWAGKAFILIQNYVVKESKNGEMNISNTDSYSIGEPVCFWNDK